MKPLRIPDSIWTTPETNARRGFERKWIRVRADYEERKSHEMERVLSNIEGLMRRFALPLEEERSEQKVVVQ